MTNLKINKIITSIILLVLTGCQTNREFNFKALEKELNIVEISTERIIQQCYFLNAEKENKWRHQYILYMLNEKNEVIPVFYPVNQDKDTCLVQLKKIEHIIHNQPTVKLCVRDQLEQTEPKNRKSETYDFGHLGKHESPYDALTFDTICNSKECYSISDTWTYTCPGFEDL